jgi:putative ABC transport system permease protein
LRDGLAIAEMVLSLVLIASAACLIDSLWRLQTRPLGFDPRDVLTATVMVPAESDGSTSSRGDVFAAEMLKRVRQLPGVVSASAASRLPALGPELVVDVQIAGRPVAKQDRPRARPRVVLPEYFRTMDIRLQEGRDFNDTDTRDAARVVIVNEALARKLFPNGDVIAQRLDFGGGDPEPEIIGVVGDVTSDRVSAERALEVYLPYPRDAPLGFSLLIRRDQKTSAPTLFAQARALAEGLNKDVAFYEASTLEEHVDAVLAPPRLSSAVLLAFALTATVLTAIGVYAVIVSSVAQRRQEIGLRLALGAPRAAILQLILRESAPLIFVSLAAGTLCSLLTLSELRAILQASVTPSAVITGGSAIFVGAVAFLACWLPARRAAREDPLHAIGLR